VSLSIQRELTEKTKPPRALFVRWPYGHPLGEPFNVAQQRWVLLDALRALEQMRTPGTIHDLPYQWRRGGPWEDKDEG
jgi:D-proline reductase (dithiol) PrdB